MRACSSPDLHGSNYHRNTRRKVPEDHLDHWHPPAEPRSSHQCLWTEFQVMRSCISEGECSCVDGEGVSAQQWTKCRSQCRFITLKRYAALKKANITHVLSVLAGPVNPELLEPYTHLAIEVNDTEDENLLEHFPVSNAFIQEGLDGGGGVLVHWYVKLNILPFQSSRLVFYV